MKKRAIILVAALLIYPISLFGAVGDIVADCQSIAAAAVLDIQPGAGVEWSIQNVYWAQSVTFQRYDGTNTLAFFTFSGPDFQNFMPGINVNNTDRIRILNNFGSAQIICYDGRVTK